MRPPHSSLNPEGTTLLLGSTIGVPFLYISDSVVRKVGPINVVVMSYLFYSIRFFGFSLIWYDDFDDWWISWLLPNFIFLSKGALVLSHI